MQERNCRTGQAQMSNRVFLHGVPDTPKIWSALLEALSEDVLTPCLPGFCTLPSEGFQCTKDEYAEWLIQLLEERYAKLGPIDIFGHDWGALLTLRAVSLRPDLIKSWAISGAAIDPHYRGHAVARIWNTPLAGEIAMALSPKKMMEIIFRLSGLPQDIAKQKVSAWRPYMRQSILALYRSANALRFDGDWVERLENLPKYGLLIWGSEDPYVSLLVARRFAEKHRAELYIEQGAGHWAIVERPRSISEALQAHWAK